MKNVILAVAGLTLLTPYVGFAAPKDKPCPDAELILRPSALKGVSSMPPKSEMMDRLYGAESSMKVYERLQELDQEFNEVVQRIAYDMFWGREGLSVRDKSLATVSSLIALQRAEQTKIHMTGYLSTGATVADVKAALGHMTKYAEHTAVEKGLSALREVSSQNKLNFADVSHAQTSAREQRIIALASFIALGKHADTKAAIQSMLANEGSLEEIRNIMIHLTVYCGFPASADAFNVLHEVTGVKDAEFEALAERVVRIYWLRPGLNSRAKSLVALASLHAQGKEAQVGSSMSDFSSLGSNAAEINAAYAQALKDPSDALLIKLAMSVTQGDLDLVKTNMTEFIKAGGGIDDIRGVLIQLTPYNGFPASMNGFAVLNQVKAN